MPTELSNQICVCQKGIADLACATAGMCRRYKHRNNCEIVMCKCHSGIAMDVCVHAIISDAEYDMTCPNSKHIKHDWATDYGCV